MKTEEEKAQGIRQAFFEYAKENELSAFDTSGYFARQFLPTESFFLKVKVIRESDRIRGYGNLLP
jgi:hypothetical protein